MRLFTYVMLMLSLSIGFYFCGLPSTLPQLVANQQGENSTLSANMSMTSMDPSAIAANATGGTIAGINISLPGNALNPISSFANKPVSNRNPLDTILFWFAIIVSAGIIVSALGGLVSGGSIGQAIGFAAFYLMPAIILFGIANLIVIPSAFFVPPDGAAPIPDIIRIPIIAIINTLTVMATVSFVRGGA